MPLNYFGLMVFGIFNSFAFLAWYSHLKAAFGDPGVVPSHLIPPEENKTNKIVWCPKCKVK